VTEIRITVGKPGDLWTVKDHLAAVDAAARASWAQMPDAKKSGVGHLVVDALLRLAAESATWLPASVDVGAKLDVHISVILPELTAAEAKARAVAEQNRVTAAAGIRALERSLRGARRP
jgi:hypothetical protein